MALDRLARGQRVAVIGRDPEKGRAFLAEATALGWIDQAYFVPADLSSVAETRQAIEQLRVRFTRVDAVVLCARHYRSTRAVTTEGFEYTFALFYLSRFVISYEMLDLLEAAERPLILNIAGPGSGTDEIRWDDLGSETDYHGMRAMAQGGQLNDLLGIEFARRHSSRKVRYVLLHPGMVNTNFSGDYDPSTAAQVEAMRASAQPIEQAIVPILEVLANPPQESLTAIVTGQRLDVDGTAFDTDAARRLFTETVTLLGRVADAAPGVSPDRLRRVLDSPVFATVATLQPDNSPHQSVVWVARDGEDVLFIVAVGSRKEQNLRRDPRVSVLISPPEAPYTYAAISGIATLSTEGAHELRDQLALEYTGQTFAEHNPDAAARHGDVAITTVRVRPQKVVGRL
ncbi:TIGR03618 family F420-dependent PPOX class oxidoreductase [Nocardia sp. NBC_01329]|uniref:TIGR03618 family F420-dependent PPOX class oxidoreductase n=1 Tax=Nocardia sp. NBC_01329 TaxID=2903594 RepID=UPI002E159A86|nr:TIGR03618 family F420-dependent PPOX class oxidoreductase [Nocardia sp. NBC_01329]